MICGIDSENTKSLHKKSPCDLSSRALLMVLIDHYFVANMNNPHEMRYINMEAKSEFIISLIIDPFNENIRKENTYAISNQDFVFLDLDLYKIGIPIKINPSIT